MNIAHMTKTPFWVALFLGTTLSGFGYNGTSFEPARVYASQMSEAAQTPLVVSNVRTSGPPPSVEIKAKSLEVSHDRYVPDNIRKKYDMENSGGPKDVPFDSALPPLTSKAPGAPGVQPESSPFFAESAPVTLSATPLVASPQPLTREVKVAVESWRGRKGENIRDVLQRWAARGGTNLMWASAESPVLQKEFTYIGKFQDAVNALIKAEGGDKIHTQYRSEGLNPVMMAPASTVTTNTPPAIKGTPPVAPEVQPVEMNPLSKIFQPEKKKDVKPETRWFALSGAPLAEVIKVWADDAGVRLIWQSERNFAVKESISQIGHFEDAVFRALSQYDAEEVRPVGEMYRDPQSGQQILLVRTEVN